MRKILLSCLLSFTAVVFCFAQEDGGYKMSVVDSMLYDAYKNNPQVEQRLMRDTTREYYLTLVDSVYDQLKSEYLYSQAIGYFRFPPCYDMTPMMKPYMERITVDSLRQNLQAALDKHVKDYGAVFAGNEAPDFTMRTTKGKLVSLKDLRSKLLFIDVWGTWCKPCIEEIPYLNKLQAKYKGNKKVQILSIACDKEKDRAKWLTFLKKHKDMTWSQYQITPEGDNVLDSVYHVFGIPRFMVIAPDGKIIDADCQRPSFDTFNEWFNGIVDQYTKQ